MIEYIIISLNGPSISQLNPFISKSCDIWLKTHRAPIVLKSKYTHSAVTDRHNNIKSKLDWD